MPFNAPVEERILILAPKGRDAEGIVQVLSGAQFSCVACSDHEQLARELKAGAGAALVAEEALLGADLARLTDWVSRQPSWSDFPFILLVSKEPFQRTASARSLLENLSNVILLERPVNAETLKRTAASALRARKRQYQARSDLLERTRAEERLRIALQAGRLGAWEVNLANMALNASENSKAMYGRDPAAPFTYNDLIAAVHPEDRELRQAAFNAAVSRGSDFDIEYRIVQPDG
jgi:PAS domain-containing protein